ncbi:hypothetical protein [Nitrososphaera sp.]|uniref:hypothetical protein n=1 Tax=Nitrososphaera sp. TaxID=1971748 RepID=UPI00317AF08B
MRRSRAAAIVIAVAVAAIVNYFALQAIMAMPCDSAASCNQRNGGLLVVVTSDVFASVMVVSELAKKR